MIQSKLWRLQNLYKIRTKDRGIITFKLNSEQRLIARDIAGQSPIRHVSLKTRQVGISTFWLIYWLDDTIFSPGTITGVLSHERNSLGVLWNIIRIAHANMPSNIRPELDTDSKTKLGFKGRNSEMFVSLDIQSTALHNLHISEWALCENQKVWATLGATSKHTNISGESRGNGMGNDFYLTYTGAQDGSNEFKYRFFPWFMHSEYRIPLGDLPQFIPDKNETALRLNQEQIHYRRLMRSKLKNDFQVHYPECEEDAWAQSGSSFFDSRKIGVLAKEARQINIEFPPSEVTDRYTVWEKPVKGHVYAIGADVAEGLDGDYSAFKVLCLTCRQEAMAYRDHVGVDTFYKDLNQYGLAYNRALLAVERNNHGHAVILGLRETSKYPNLFADREPDPRLFGDLSKPPKEKRYGWLTTAANKVAICDALKIALEGDSEEDENTFRPDYTVRDLTLLSECLTFQRDGVKLSAATGKHDDAVMASAIAYQMFLHLKHRSIQDGLGRVSVVAEREIPVEG